MKRLIVSNSVIKNEQYWFAYGLASIFPYLDHAFITDTGSIDNTKKIIKYFINKYPNKITYLEKYPKNDDEMTYNFTDYKNELVRLSREFGAFYQLTLDGDETYYDYHIKAFINKLQTLPESWKMIAVNTRYSVLDLSHMFECGNIWHYRFFNIKQTGEWSLPLGDILWTNPAVLKNQRLTLELIPNQIDMMHLSLLKRSPHDDKTTARIRRQTLRKPGGKNVGQPSIHNFGFPEVFFNQELLELTQNPYIKKLFDNIQA